MNNILRSLRAVYCFPVFGFEANCNRFSSETAIREYGMDEDR